MNVNALKKSALAIGVALSCVVAGAAFADISPSAEARYQAAVAELSAASNAHERADAIAALELSLEAGEGRAGIALAQAALNDLSYAGDPAYVRALNYYAKAIALNAPGAKVGEALTVAKRGFAQGKDNAIGAATLTDARSKLSAVADSNDAEVLWNLGFLESVGIGGPQDSVAGVTHITKAADQGHGLAALWTANRYAGSNFAGGNMERHYLEIAAKAGLNAAKLKLAQLDSDQHTPIVSSVDTSTPSTVNSPQPQAMGSATTAPEVSVVASTSAPELPVAEAAGDTSLRSQLAAAHREIAALRAQLSSCQSAKPALSPEIIAAINTRGLEAVVHGNYEQALTHFRQAAEYGHVAAQSNLGLLYLNGTGVPRDVRQAASLFEQAAKQGNVTAAENLARLHDFGIGVPQDRYKAILWYQKAEKLGSTLAPTAIHRLKSR